MQIFFDFLVFSTLLGLFQAILLAGALAGLKRGDAPANRILSAFLVSLSIIVGGLILAHTKYVLTIPHLGQLHVPFGFLPGPLLFLYVRALGSPPNVFKRSDLLHFVPFLLLFIYLLPFYLQSGEDKILYLKQALDYYPPEWRIRAGLFSLQHLIYLIFTYLALRKKARPENSSISLQSPNLYLAQFFTVASTTIWLVGFFRFLVAHRLETNLLAPFVAGVFICGLVFKAVRSAEVLGVEAEKTARKYEKSTLKADDAENYLVKIIDLMETEKPYLDKNLTLDKLAGRLMLSPPHLSQLINERFHKNFTDFINQYRVEEFKRRLADPLNDRFTMVAIAEDSGFNSKSTFNSTFKKHTNLTPSEFKKTLLNGN